MRKIIFLVLIGFGFISAHAKGDRQKEAAGELGPVAVAGISLTTGTAILIAAAGAGQYNCLDYFHVSSSNTYTAIILNGNTTSYQVTFPSTMATTPVFEPAFCGSANTAMTLKVTTSASSTTINSNYKGFVGR